MPKSTKTKRTPQIEELTALTSYKEIRECSSNLKKYIYDNGIPFGLKQFPYEIIIDIDPAELKGLGRLQKETGCKKVLCVLGLGKGAQGFNEFKVCFLALNSEDKVHKGHKEIIDGRTTVIDGEQTWPPEDTVTNPNVDLP